MELILGFLALIAFLLSNIFLVMNKISRQLAQIAEILPFVLGEEYEDESYVDEIETLTREELLVQERIEERDKAFDERIARIKEELASGVTEKRGTTAEVLHEGIENLPHDSIKHIQTNPPEEYSI